MLNQQKKSNSVLAVLALGAALSALVGGCAGSRYSAAGPWAWTPPPMLAVGDASGNSGSSSAVVVPPGRANAQVFAYNYDQMPEYDRRDSTLSVRTNDPYAGWLGYPEAERPSLDHQRSFYTNRSPDRYTYPTRGSDRRGYRSHRSRRGHWR